VCRAGSDRAVHAAAPVCAQAYQEPVLDALAAWLDADPGRVEQRLLEQAAIERLVLLLPTMATAGMATSQ
jgi:hypothetical protein